MKTLLKKLLGDKAGASAAEYALILAVIGGGLVVAFGDFGEAIQTSLDTSAQELQ